MSLRNQPYLPLYVQDFITDEKLSECSASATGVYIRIMCLMHKSEHYGQILLKQKDKQSDKQVINFALKIGKHLPYNLHEIESALDELISEGVLTVEGDCLFQKRMVRDCEISTKRANAGKKGGEKTQSFALKIAKAKKQANTEIEIDNENEDKNKIKIGGFNVDFIAEEFMPIVKDWIEYKAGIGDKYKTEKSFAAMYSNLLKLSGGNPVTARQIVDQSMGNNWKGLFELKSGNNKSHDKSELPKRARSCSFSNPNNS